MSGVLLCVSQSLITGGGLAEETRRREKGHDRPSGNSHWVEEPTHYAEEKHTAGIERHNQGDGRAAIQREGERGMEREGGGGVGHGERQTHKGGDMGRDMKRKTCMGIYRER